ncbi:MAG: hypothetical protein ACW98D_07615 [Promethearchaeota archaeon]|jgi:hypothetical protein
MEEFLKKLQLSNNAIEIYLKVIGRSPLTYYELYSIVSKTPLDEFSENLSQLINGGLLIQLKQKTQEMLVHYYAIPPILPIINYYDNINANLKGIKDSIYDLLANTVNQTFQQNEGIQLDTLLDKFHEVRKDIEEDIIIQKQEIEDIVEGMEELKSLDKDMSDLSQLIKVGTQTQFTHLMKQISSIESEIVEKVNSLEFKKHKQEILDVIEQIFSEKLDILVKDFSKRLHETVEQEFDKATKPMENLITSTFQHRDDFKLILLNMLNNFETKMNKTYEVLKNNKESLSKEKENLEINIIESMNAVIQSSIDEVSKLNDPIENLMKSYHQQVSSSDKSLITNIWTVTSLLKINEEIQKAISTSQDNLLIVVPHLENHLAVEQFENISRSLKIRIVSSEPHTNSTVKKFNSITNITFKTLENEDLVVIKRDNNFITLGVMQKDRKDQLDDFVGIGSDIKPFIELLDPLIKNIWEESYSDSFYASQKTKTSTVPSKSIREAKTGAFKEIKPITSPKIQKTSAPQISTIDQKENQVSSEKISHSIPLDQKATNQITEIKKKLQEKIKFATKPTPKPEKTAKKGDKSSILINAAFDNLTQKLHTLKGDEFSTELQEIADLVLEKKGFSVTLHKLRSSINQYRFNDLLLEEKDIKEILDNIDTWKEKLT